MENPVQETVSDLHKEVQERASEEGGTLLTRIALTTALIAALAAVTGYLAGERADEALIDQIHSSDQWAYYQSKSIKSSVLSAKVETIQAMGGKQSSEADQKKLARYDEEMQEIRKEAEEKQKASTHRIMERKILANGVTLFQIAIAIGAIAAITRKKELWYGSMGLGAAGLAQLIHEMLFS